MQYRAIRLGRQLRCSLAPRLKPWVLSALAICLSPATAVGQTGVNSQSFGTLGPRMADGSLSGNINTATNFSIGNLTSSPFGQSGYFVGMPQQNLQQITGQPVTYNTTIGTSLSNFGSLAGAFGHFASTSITELTNTPGNVAFLIAGVWTPGTFFPLIREPLAGTLTVSWTQTPPNTGTLSASATFTTPAGFTPQPDKLPTEPLPDPSHPLPDPSHPNDLPFIGPAVDSYGVVQPIARQMGLTTLGTLHERVGGAAADAACLNDGALITKAVPLITKAPPVPCYNSRPAAWGRLFGQQIDNHYEAFADPRATGQIVGLQTGVDLWRGSLIQGHSDTVGLYFAYSNANVGVSGLVSSQTATAYILQHTGSVHLNAPSVGGYWTHYGPGGWYIDAVLQGSFYSGDATTQFTHLPTKGTGFISSLEAGYPIPLPWFGPRFVLQPEGQIIWQQVSFHDADDGFGTIGLGTTSGATGRLGLRGAWTINETAGRVWQPYVRANVWRDFGADATTMFGPVAVPLLEQATRLEFAGGLSAKILPRLTLYAQAGYQFAVSGTDGGRRDGVKGNFGVNYAW